MYTYYVLSTDCERARKWSQQLEGAQPIEASEWSERCK